MTENTAPESRLPRFIQGIFDDKADASRFERFGRHFDPEENTASLIAALPEWYAHGLRAFTVGFQGGGPCFTMADCVTDLKLCLSHNSPVSFLVLLLLVFCCFVMLEYLYFYL